MPKALIPPKIQVPPMFSKSAAWCVIVMFLGSFVDAAQAGWHHRRACCPAPNYYSAPQGAPQAGPNLLVDALMPVVLDILRSRIGNQGNQGNQNPTTQPSPVVDMNALKGELAQIAASVENSNSTLRRHGEELTNLRLDMTEVKNEVSLIKSLVGATSTLQTDVKNILDKLPRQTKNELAQSLTSNDFFRAVNAQNKLNAAEKKALIDALKTAVEETLTAHYSK